MISKHSCRLLLMACMLLQLYNVHSIEVVKVTVFYETLCPDSIDFFVGQIPLALRELRKHIRFDLVPYGHAKQNYTEGQWSFTCQHGKKECRYNKLHACFIKKEKSKNKLLPLLTCLIKHTDEVRYLKKVLAFTDGTEVQVMPPAQDHKRALDGDKGGMTGGMGAYCPCPYLSGDGVEGVKQIILQPVVDRLRKDGTPFVGELSGVCGEGSSSAP
ncbi:hypothetical protein LSTR_LSTR011067 [Laodelphax striatellus]|uniref:Phosphoribosylglycinamide synthetase ATP-grasp (A) domain-containing protein n=1 Tax=Laodelphax striatellus TaxID=195883 RepID=A0A482XSP7_LAOST|nr:hypothetical protein LSTR_LSTR011067 [Laodelphax striatellus]